MTSGVDDVGTNYCRCGKVGARLVSLESDAENDFVTHNLLWIGFLGEAYTGELFHVLGGAPGKTSCL